MMITKAFITGSHAYGEPTKKSDVDLVVFVSPETMVELRKLADRDLSQTEEDYTKLECHSVRFGKLNVLCCITEEAYRTWRRGTKRLKAQAPVSREFACDFFAKLREEAK